MALHCCKCLDKRTEIVKLVDGVCPKCGTDYAATGDVFNIPLKVKPGKKGGK